MALKFWAARKGKSRIPRRCNTICHCIMGLAMGPIYFLFATKQLMIDDWIAAVISIILAIFSSISLATSKTARCISGLSLPQVFTGKGRSVLLAYVLIMAHNGPLMNAVHNSNVLLNVTACWQHQLAQISRQNPLNSDEQVKGGQLDMKQSLNRFRDSFIQMNSLYNDTWGEIASKYEWLRGKESTCEHLEKILKDRAFNIIYELYNSKTVSILAWWLPPSLNKMAEKIIQDGFKTACSVSKEDAEGLLKLQSLMAPKLGAIKKYVEQEGGLGVSIERKWAYNMTTSVSMDQVTDAMRRDVEITFGWIPKFFGVINFVLGTMSLLVVINAGIYLRKFLRHPYYDNQYYGSGLREYCKQRVSYGGVTVLPLQRWEKSRMVAPFSPRMTPRERRKLILSLLVVTISALTIATYVALDLTLFKFLETVNSYGPIIDKLEAPTMPQLHVSGNGIIGDLFMSFVEAFKPFVTQYAPQINITECMKFEAQHPDYNVYYKLGTWMIVCALVTLTNAWGLRLRHIVAEYYYPQVAEKRAAWLYDDIFTRRKYSRNILYRRIRRVRGVEGKILDKIWKKLSRSKNIDCLGCGCSFSDESLVVRCLRKSCTGVLCLQCDEVLRHSCPICKRNCEEDSDISIEKDSSDEETAEIIISIP